jgi:hypothetical protein
MKRPTHRSTETLCDMCSNNLGQACAWEYDHYPWAHNVCNKYNVSKFTPPQSNIKNLPAVVTVYPKKEPEPVETKIYSASDTEKCIKYAYLP